MKTIIIPGISILFLTLCLGSLQAQNNSLDFDGVDDFATAPNASGLIANSSQMSMAFWVYPRNGALTNHNFDGFLGFRDNSYADFYILQLSSNGLECRFRNSSGTAYDVLYTGLLLNTWQHFAFTYDGSSLKLYHNGQLKQTLPASGVITTTTGGFYLGKLVYSTYSFSLDGKLDDVGLWKKTLSASEVLDIYGCGAQQVNTELKLHYKFDQGIANGSNPTVNSIVDSKGNINAGMTGFALNGASSNWVNGVITATPYPISANICNGDSFLFAGQYLHNSGIYTQVFQTSGPCDSMVVLTLNIAPSYHFQAFADLCQGDSMLWLGQFISSAGLHTLSYQSVNGCDSIYTIDISIIPKPVNFTLSGPASCLIGQIYSYTAPVNSSVFYFWNVQSGQIITQSGNTATARWISYGNAKIYAYAMESHGCRSDTSFLPVWVGQAGIDDIGADKVQLFPNPVSMGYLTVNLMDLQDGGAYIISDMQGRTILQGVILDDEVLDVGSLANGTYIFTLHEGEDLIARKRIVIESTR